MTNTNSNVASAVSEAFFKYSITTSGIITFSKSSASYSTRPSSFNAIDWRGNTTTSGSNLYPLDPNETFVKSVENGTLELADGEISKLYTLTKGQNTDNSIVFKSYSMDTSDAPSSLLLEAYFIKHNLLCFRRSNYSGTLSISFSIVEFYEDQVSVTNGDYSFSGSPNEGTVTISGVDLNKSFLLSHYSLAGLNVGAYYSASLVRCAIKDANTLGFYAYGATATTPSHISYSLVEDIAGNNFYVENALINDNSSTVRHYTDYAFPIYSTFHIDSYAGAYTTDDADDSLFRGFYNDSNLPVEYNKQSAGYNSYIYSAAIHIIRSNRRYVQHINASINTTTNYYDIAVNDDFTTFSGSMSLIHPSTVPAAQSNNTSANSFRCALYKGVLDEPAMEINITGGTVPSYSSAVSFNLINWLGYGDYTYDINSTKTNSIVESIELANITGATREYTYYMTKGQDPTKCVPFATWFTDNQGAAADQFFKFNFYDDPKKLVVHSCKS